MKLLAVLLLVVASASAEEMPTWSKFFLIMFENHGYNQVMGNSYWSALIKNSFLLTNYRGVTHPSQPNYVAQLGGNYFTCTSDTNCNLNKPNLVDLLDTKYLSWKAYEENYTPNSGGACNTATSIGSEYYRKHNPFMTFTDIQNNLTRCQNIVNAQTYFLSDVQANRLPNFGYYTPNIDDDSHNQGLDYSGQYITNWINTFYTPYPNTWSKVLFMVTFDEDEGTEGNHVVAFFRGPNATPGLTGVDAYNHYSITKFVEQNWGLGNLGQNDVNATNFANELH